MNALFDFLPHYCPNCGAALHKTDWKATEQDRRYGLNPAADYHAHASHSCGRCGLSYQAADTEHLLKAAEASGGDLHHYQ